MPYVHLAVLVDQPPMWTGAPFGVRPSPSIAASFVAGRVGHRRAPAQSPTTTCTGAASAATVSGTTSAAAT